MENKGKKLIAIVITVLVVMMAAFSKDMAANKENMENKYIDQIMDMSFARQEVLQGSNQNQKIKIIEVNGVIQSDYAADMIVKDLKQSREDESVKGVILKVNSPGGSVYASEKIANQVKKLKNAGKPIYTVMEEFAASGGYYISAPTDKIYASNETWTGSIGVIISSVSLGGLFEKYGIKEQNVTSGALKDAGSSGHDMREDEKKYYQGLVDSAYQRFVELVADGRKMSKSDVKKLADGRVYDGSQAIKNGLIDEIGDLDKAIGAMTSELELEDPLVIKNQENSGFFGSIFSKISDLRNSSKSDLQILNDMLKDNEPRPMYLMGGYHE